MVENIRLIGKLSDYQLLHKCPYCNSIETSQTDSNVLQIDCDYLILGDTLKTNYGITLKTHSKCRLHGLHQHDCVIIKCKSNLGGKSTNGT